MSSTSMIKDPTWWENLEEDDLSQPDENEDNILMNSYQGLNIFLYLSFLF